MVPEKDEVTLIMPSDNSPLLELRVLREQRGDHAADARPQLRVEVVHDELGRNHHSVVGAVVRDVLVKLQA